MIDTLVCSEKNGIKKLAGLLEGDLRLFVVQDSHKANEGNVYLGKITKKIQSVHGKKAYFINIGTGQDVFINAEEQGLEELEAHEGQDIIVQVLQEKRAEKGARMSRFLNLSGINVVFCPYGNEINISSKITDDEKREELVQLVSESALEGGWIVRTHAQDATKEDIKKEISELTQAFQALLAAAKTSKAPCLLLEKDNLLLETAGRAGKTLKKIVVDSHVLEQELGKEFSVSYDRNAFETYGIEEMVHEALKKEVKLSCGGRIFIEETKAFVAIDVDSGEGSAQGGFGRLNQEAAKEIAKQIVLRNLAGKILIDFAGLPEIKYLKPVLDILTAELENDASKTKILGLSRAGNVELIRQRRRPTLSDVLTQDCPSCFGTGRVEK